MKEKNDSNEQIAQVLNKYFPDESPTELLARVQSLLTFIQGLPAPLLKAANNHKSSNNLPLQQPSMLHLFNKTTKQSYTTNHSLEHENTQEKVITTLLGQITMLQKIDHLAPAQQKQIKLRNFK